MNIPTIVLSRAKIAMLPEGTDWIHPPENCPTNKETLSKQWKVKAKCSSGWMHCEVGVITKNVYHTIIEVGP